MNCPNCQASLSDNARFCTGCGSAVARPDDSGSHPSEAATRIVSTPPASPLAPPSTSPSSSETAQPGPADPLIGRVLEDKYGINSVLGEGGMGVVYRARRLRIGDEVAVKVLHPKFVKDEATLERFRREARAAAMLHHPNVVTIYDYGEGSTAEAPAFIVMELVGGISLRDVLEREQRLAPDRAVALMREICNGVGAAHRNHIIHRDLKPDNIIVLPAGAHGENETAKVLDFGIAKLRDLAGEMHLTQTGMVMGTPYYMSPEQCRAEPLDPRSDVYSLGALLYEMLAGDPPFVANTLTGVVAKHLTEPPPPLPYHLGVPAAVEAVIGRALAKDPNLRQPDATMLARDLQAAMTANLTQPLGRSQYDGGAGQATQVFHPPVATVQQSGGYPTSVQAGPYQTTPPLAPRPTVQEHLPERKSKTGLIVAGVLSLLILIGLGIIAVLVMTNRRPAPSSSAIVTNPGSAVQPINPTPLPTNANRTEPAATTPATPADPKGRVEAKILGNQIVDRNDLTGIGDTDLRLLRNTVYARHGRIFEAAELNRYFVTRPWYHGRPEYSDSELTANDRANAGLIKSVEGTAAPSTDTAALQREILESLNGWVDAMRHHDLDAYMSYYGVVLDPYYKRSNVTRDDVRGDKRRAFSRFATLDIQMSNVTIKPDDTPGRVAVTYNKVWDFVEADGRPYNGSVRSQLWLEKSGNRWLITGERDL